MEEKVEGKLSSVCVEAIPWEIQPGLNFQELHKPLEIDNYKEKEISRLLSTALLGSGCRYGNRGELQQIKPNRTAWTN